MNSGTGFLTFATTMLVASAAAAAEGPVVWADTSCSYFIVQLPEGSPPEMFGLFRSNTDQMPKVGDIVQGDIVAEYKVDVTGQSNRAEVFIVALGQWQE